MEGKSKEPSIKDESNVPSQTDTRPELTFKRPTLLVGKIGRLPRKLQTAPVSDNKTSNEIGHLEFRENEIRDSPTNSMEHKHEVEEEEEVEESPETTPSSSAQQQMENLIVLPYEEPSWSGLPEPSGKSYVFEVLKNGSIIEAIDLMKKPFWTVGRLATCDICMQHPTVSRYHAIVQYRDIPSESDPAGFYIYDLGSTHGTFLNGKNNKLKPRVYAPIRVGHMIRFGCSQRSFILTGPEDDQEEESEHSVTELKRIRDEKIRERQEEMRLAELKMEEKRKRDEEKGVDWGMGDDADDDEDDITENPYASTNNEELYLDDPKKALRGFFEREGVDLDYDCTEQGMGQFLCKVELPLDDEMGRPIVAEALHRGKKKEAVVQCALEACRILDRFGVLRQATHESKKRKARNWEENDYYDSDEDTFLDRTGTIEKKREKRMKIREPEKVETYESLLEKEKNLSASIADIEKKLNRAQAKLDESGASTNAEEDSLDSYMKGLDQDKPDKHTIAKYRLDLVNLRKNHANVMRLANIARPANLPPLKPTGTASDASASKGIKRKLPIFGKRRAVPVKFPAKPVGDGVVREEKSRIAKEPTEEESEEEEGEESQQDMDEPKNSSAVGSSSTDCKDEVSSMYHSTETFEVAANCKETLIKLVRKVAKLMEQDDRMRCHGRALIAKKRKLYGWYRQIIESGDGDGLEYNKLCTEAGRLESEMNRLYDDKGKTFERLQQAGSDLQSLSEEIDDNIDLLKDRLVNDDSSTIKKPPENSDWEKETPDDQKPDNPEGDGADKKKKKNQKRNEQRLHKAELEKQRGYKEDASRENYNMWVPPNDQSGDGRTDLNDKYGY